MAVNTSKNNGSTSSKGRKIKIIKHQQEKIWQHAVMAAMASM